MAILSVSLYTLLFNIINASNNDISKMYTQSLQSKIDAIEKECNYINDISFAVRNNINISNLVKADEKNLNDVEYSYIYKASSFLNTCVPVNSLIDKVMVVYKNNDIVIMNTTAVTNLERFYSSSFSVSGMNYEQYKEYMKFDYSNKWLKEEDFNISESTHNDRTSIPYIVPLTNQNANYPQYDSAIVCLFNTKKLNEFITDENSNFIAYKLEDANKNLLSAYNTEVNIKENKNTSFVVKSSDGSITLTGYIDPTIISSKKIELNYQFIFYTVLSIVVAIGLSIFLTFRNAKPFGKLKKQMESLDIIHDDKGDIFSSVEKSLTDLTELKKVHINQINMFEENEKLNLFSGLLNNDINYNEKKEDIEKYFEFLKNDYVVGLLKIDMPINCNEELTEQEAKQIMSLHITSLLKQYLQGCVYSYIWNKDKIIFVLSGEFTDTWKSNLSKELLSIKDELLDTFLIRCIFTFSPIIQGEQNLHTAQMQIYNTYRVKYKPNNFDNIFCNTVAKHSRIDIDLSEVQKLGVYIKDGNAQEAIFIINNIKHRLSNSNCDDDVYISAAFNTINNIIVFTANELSLEVQIPVYNSDETIYNLFEKFISCLTDFCVVVAENKLNKTETLINQFEKYIDEHYSDAGLMVKDIAENIGLSEKYLSNFIKTKTNKTVGAYILEARMKKATEMLLQESVNINDVAIKCGFYTANTFYKAFKRSFGLAPGIWREQQLVEKSNDESVEIH